MNQLDRKASNGGYPFRLGATSYVTPGDLVHNGRAVAGRFGDMELVLFDTGGACNYPGEAALAELDSIATTHGLTYTVHLPTDALLGSADEDFRRRSVEKCLRVIELVRPLRPHAYILHFDGDLRGGVPSHDMERWRNALRGSSRELVDGGAPAGLICVENLDYPFELVEDIVFDSGFSVCLDVGHLVYYRQDYRRHIDDYLAHSKVAHLHGVRDGADHRDIALFDDSRLGYLLEKLSADGGDGRVVTLEMFSEEDLARSVERLGTHF